MNDPQKCLTAMLNAAIAAANPNHCLAPYLPKNTHRAATVVGAGKAAASMAQALEQQWQGPLRGLVLCPYGHSVACQHITVHEAAHPVPDQQGEQIARQILNTVASLGEDDLVICLLSGGGSALLGLPAPGITLADKQHVNRALLKSGANIADINCVRKHLSAIKGGRLAEACYPAELLTLAISDVPGDDPSVIASGPTVGDDTTRQDAMEILKRYKIDRPEAVMRCLQNPASETRPPNDPCYRGNRYHVIATPHQALQAAAAKARQLGIEPLVLGDQLEGESSELAKMHGAMARYIQQYGQPLRPPCVILSGGETSVTVKGTGRGGRNVEFLLSLAIYLQGASNIYALAADTDGIDGSEDNAGAYLEPGTWQRAKAKNINARALLLNNDGYSFFEQVDALLKTGPTLTNVNDFRAILIVS